MDAGTDHPQGAAQYLLAADRPQPGRPARDRDRDPLHRGPGQVQRYGRRLDAQIRSLARVSSAAGRAAAPGRDFSFNVRFRRCVCLLVALLNALALRQWASTR